MNEMMIKMYVMCQDLLNREEGQDLIEYALLAALIALAAVVMIGKVGTAINQIFSNVSSSL